MTIENELYGGGWQRCSNCGVKDRPDQLYVVGRDTNGNVYVHIESKRKVCEDWKRTLERAKPADLEQAAQKDRFVLCTRTDHNYGDELLAEVHEARK